MIAPAQQPGYFDALYAENLDPWGFETRPYERTKYAATLAALPRARFASALEVGCSIGVLTALLATRCDAVLGIDVAVAALDRARTRCRDLTGVAFAPSALPKHAPAGPFDLVLLSEVLYYFDRAQLVATAQSLIAVMACDAIVVLVHWLGPTPDYPLTGDEAVAAFEDTMQAAGARFTVVQRARTADYRLDVLARVRST